MFDWISNIISKSQNKKKITLIIASMLIFSILYLLLPDEDFSGVNNIREMIKNELIKKKVLKDIDQSVDVAEATKISKDEVKTEAFTSNISTVLYHEYENKEPTLQDDVVEIENIVKDEYTPETIEKSIFEKYFNRLYFSVITGCLLGYGDVYPVSVRAKSLVSLQALITIMIIVY